MSSGMDVNDTLGCLAIASLLSMGLWGAGSVQVYYYFNRYYDTDSLLLKLQVFSIWAVSTAQQALVLASTYGYLVTHYAEAAQLQVFDSLLRNSIILTGILCIIVQSIFVDRIYCLSRNNLIITGVTAVLALGQFVCTVIYYAKCYSSSTVEEFQSNSTIMHVDQIVTVVADVAIALALIYLFCSNRTGFRKNAKALDKLMAFTVNTGALTAVFAVLCLITGLVAPKTLVYLLFYYFMSRLYMNSVMSSLNARPRGPAQSGENSSNAARLNYNMYDMHGNRPDISSQVRPGGRVVTIKVDTETILDNDRHMNFNRSDSDGDIGDAYGSSKPMAY